MLIGMSAICLSSAVSHHFRIAQIALAEFEFCNVTTLFIFGRIEFSIFGSVAKGNLAANPLVTAVDHTILKGLRIYVQANGGFAKLLGIVHHVNGFGRIYLHSPSRVEFEFIGGL